ncbi:MULTISPECIES: ABC transporter permease [Modicisalibacter]|uniref:ABC transporter permease n=1 Tax=Modicisalibacter TaxID=574347 RepID=UPI00100BA229|nr:MULTISPECIES: ABC transporter permease [Halomonadaceae]MBZ9560507.1 ABC transporter permease [Modicisalibacter sp. R2A 31.J]MBZ9575089.1 ABC transporter permease [Modicisalibacter sp. MOD 31.J]
MTLPSRIFTALRWLLIAAVVLWLAAALAAGLVSPFSPDAIVGGAWSGAFWQDTSEHAGQILGTDQLGRDMLTRLLYGTRNTMFVALTATFACFVLGIVFGFWAAIVRGKFDMIASRIVDLIIAVPSLIVTLLVITAMGPSIPVLIGVIAVVDGTRVYRLARLVGMNVTTLEFFETAKLRGENKLWLMTREVLPNVVRPLITEFGLRFCFIFLFIASLSFLGLGVQPPTADLGSMVRENAPAISFGVLAPLFPAAVIATLAIAVNFVTDAIADRVRPTP